MNSYPDRGYLFSIEGIDGSGKTTTAKTLVNFINISFIEDGAVYFREPTSESDAGRKVRSYLDEHQHIADNELIDLFVADREYDVTNNIQPALDKQKIVVLDRYFVSNAVYEHSNVYPWRTILARNRLLYPEPDAIFILDPGVDVCKQRICDRGEGVSQYETREELQRTHDIFDEIIKYDLEGHYIVLETDGWKVGEVALAIQAEIIKMLPAEV